MRSDEQISKTLSFWLRHRPDAAGLTLTETGWAEVDGVLAAFAREGAEVTWERLVQVVDANDKQRFELSADAAGIRARQGHSIAVKGEWPVKAPPEHLYHGTVERFLPAILAEGLKPMRRHHVHLSPDAETARKVGARRGSAVVLTVQAARLAAMGKAFMLTENGIWLTDHVPPTFLARG